MPAHNANAGLVAGGLDAQDQVPARAAAHEQLIRPPLQDAVRPGLEVIELQDQRVLTGSVVVLPGAELLKSQLLIEGNRRLVVVRNIQDHFAHPSRRTT